MLSCSTQKNTWATRSFHQMKTRYNIHYNGEIAYQEGLQTIRESHFDNYSALLPLYPVKWFALLLIVVLGVSFSLVPAALWPSVPKIIDPVILGSAYSLIFWIQNIGLCLVPLLIGVVLKSTGGYVAPMCIFASFGVLAFIMSFFLKMEDRKKGYGLELPNIKK